LVIEDFWEKRLTPRRRREATMTTHPLKLALAGLLLTCAAPLWAADIALVIGNENYEEIRDLRRGDNVVSAASALDRAGIDVVGARNADLSEMQSSVAQFVQMAPNADGLIVVLSGRFMHSATDTYLLPVDSDRPGIARLSFNALPLSTVLAVLSASPERAVLVLVGDGESDQYGAYLRAGIGQPTIPEGVTIVSANTREGAGFMRDVLAEPGASIPDAVGATRGMRAAGYLPDNYAFLTPEAVVDEAEVGYWELVQELDTLNAYRRYLERYPNGAHADEARQRVESYTDEPNRRARLAEEALNLTRENRQQIQRALTILDFRPRGIDGIFGPGTRGAISRWQDANNLRVTSYLNVAQINRLLQQGQARAEEQAAEAEARRLELERQDRDYWSRTGLNGGEDNFRAYLQRYPDGLYAEIANARLAAIDERKRNRAERRDRRAWEQAQELNSLQGYRVYLNAFPNGVFADEARARIAVYEEEAANAAILERARAEEESLGLNRVTRQLVERRLNVLGLKPGRVDGEFNDRTRRAIRRFQDRRNLEVTGYLNEATMVRLLAGGIISLFE